MARFRRHGYRRRSTTRSSQSRAKPPQFPKGSLADWEKRYAELNRLLQEAIAKDAAVQDACMPLRRRLREIVSRRTQAWDEHRSTLWSLFVGPSKALRAESGRLDAEQRQVVQRIFAIAGENTFAEQYRKPLWGRTLKSAEEMTDLDQPLYTPHVIEIESIRKEIRRLAINKPTPEEDAAWWRDQVEQKHKQERKQQREAAKPEREAAKAEREAAKAQREAAKNRKAEAERAAVASAIGKAREHADNVKRSLRKDHDCPYCGSELGDQPHADHIYPLSKGGRSVAVNMVYVCAVCNVKKADMTLAAFVATHRLDRDTIESRLQQLSKEY